MAEIKKEYHGEVIHFSEEKEKWYVIIDGECQYHKSLHAIKKWIDKQNKKAFKRVPIFTKGSWDSDEFKKATITSVGVNGQVFMIEEGSKNAEHCDSAYERTEKNQLTINKINVFKREIKRMEEKLEAAEEELVKVDLENLRKKVLGENYNNE